MAKIARQREVIRSQFVVGKRPAEIRKQRRQPPYRRYHRFEKGSADIADRQRAGAPKRVHTAHARDQVEKMVSSDRRLGIRDISEALDMSFETARQIIKGLGYRKVSCKWVPNLLSGRQKEARVHAANKILFCRAPQVWVVSWKNVDSSEQNVGKYIWSSPLDRKNIGARDDTKKM